MDGTSEKPPFDWSVFDGVRCVFWVCGDHEKESVTWERTDAGMVPRCNRCGKTGAAQ